MSEHGSDAIRSWNQMVITEFRDSDGKVGGMFQGVPLLLMTTQGRKTGKPHINPAVYLRDGARYLVFASNAGEPTNPDWYYNLLASPQVTIEVGTGEGVVKPYATRAVPLDGRERDHFWEHQCSLDPAFRGYEEKTTRTIPVVALHPLDLTGPPEQVAMIGERLILGHDTLRADLRDIRSQIDGTLTAEPQADSAGRPAANPTDDLHQSCLSYCYGLQIHHVREDGAFTVIEERFPQLTPALDRLRADHYQVEKTLAEFETFLDQGPTDPGALGRALDSVVAGLEEHFAYEEEHLLPALGLRRPPPATPGG